MLLQPQQRGVHGALIQSENIFAYLLDAACNPESVQRTQHVKSLEDHHVQRALQNFRFVAAQDRSFGRRKEDITTHLEYPKVTSKGPGTNALHSLLLMALIVRLLGAPNALRQISEIFVVRNALPPIEMRPLQESVCASSPNAPPTPIHV